ncbi:ribonuclease H-like [Belonocnema kinseyi]|uniref:ribonuclease H-like n=1 Tax=Belonocnema kinseyi TaxID=2817044 RepID=UPI00143D6D7D|nr:ribonuclease H-like [Belonocnema kinseyi]
MKVPEGRLTKWLLKLQEYSNVFECNSGKVNRWVEALSSNPVDEANETDSSVSDSKDSSKSVANICETLDVFPMHIRSLGLKSYPNSSSGKAAKQASRENLKQNRGPKGTSRIPATAEVRVQGPLPSTFTSNPAADETLKSSLRASKYGPKAGVGVWFNYDHALNVSKRASSRQTNNSAEIAAALIAIKQATNAGIKKLTTNSDSRYLIDGLTKWQRNWEDRGWFASNNRSVINRREFEKLKTMTENLDVKWRYILAHK